MGNHRAGPADIKNGPASGSGNCNLKTGWRSKPSVAWPLRKVKVSLGARVSADKAEEFLVELLNSQLPGGFSANDSKRAVGYFDRFSELLPRNHYFGKKPNEPMVIPAFVSDESAGAIYNKGADIACLRSLGRAKVYLAAAWRAPTALGREVFLLQLIAAYLQTEAPQFSYTAGYNAEYADEEAKRGVDAFCLVLIRALHALDRMRFCLNPECPAPYFFTKKRRQRYCTEKCAGAGQRELKRVWWTEHGTAWRNAGKASAKKSQRKRFKLRLPEPSRHKTTSQMKDPKA